VLSIPFHGTNVDGVKYFNTLNATSVVSNVVTDAVGAVITSSNGGNIGSVDSIGPFGYLSEKSLSSTLIRSEEFDNVAWIKGFTTVTANATVAPDGNTTADKLAEDNTNNTHYAYQDVSFVATSGIGTAFAVYAKAVERSWVYLAVYSTSPGTTAGAYFDLTNGVIGGVAAGYKAYIQKAANGFYRCAVTSTAVSSTYRSLIAICTGDGGTSAPSTYIGTTGSGIYIWGAQGEVNNYHNGISSYVPTGGGSASRGSDSLQFPVAGNVINGSGTAYAELRTNWTTRISGSVESRANALVVDVGHGALFSTSEANTIMRIEDGTTSLPVTGLPDMSTNIRKCASSWGQGNTIMVTGSGSNPATASFDGSMNVASIGIGSNSNGTPPSSGPEWYGTIRNVNFWTVSANSGQLQTITT
jgi:hypothetical protein